MKITHSMFIMFVGSFLVQYFLMPPIMVNRRENITNSIGKAYLASIMGLFMVLIEVMMHDHQYHVLSLNWYALLFAFLAVFVYLYRNQIGIHDKQYLAEMIEHHAMALFTSEEILKKTSDYDTTKLAKNIKQQQMDDIRVMKEQFLKGEQK